jgi:hypothetical protein
LIGLHRIQQPESPVASVPGPDAAARDEQVQAQARTFLQANDVPSELVDAMFRHTPPDVYWLSERDEQTLGARSPAFERFLEEKCAWNDALEQSVYKGERSIGDLKEMWSCRTRVTQPAAQKALALALKDKAAVDASGKPTDIPAKPKVKPAPQPKGTSSCYKRGTVDPNGNECADGTQKATKVAPEVPG